MYFSLSKGKTHQKIITVLDEAENEKVHINFIHKKRLCWVTDVFGLVHRYLNDETESLLEMFNLRGSSSFIHRLSITDPKRWLMWSVLLKMHCLFYHLVRLA